MRERWRRRGVDGNPRDRRLVLVAGVGSLVAVALLLGYVVSREQPREPVEVGPAAGPIDQGLGPDQPGDVLGLGRSIHVAVGAAPGGDGSVTRPLGTIQAALQLARPGDAIRVGPGTYAEVLHTVRAGTQEKPIWLVGDNARIVAPPGAATSVPPAVLPAGPEQAAADNDGRLVTISHDHLVLTGFDISGGNKDVWIFKANYVRILRNTIHNAGGECVRIKYFSSHNEVAFNTINQCGLTGFNLAANHKNGETIYIGTAPEQLSRNPTPDRDQSNENSLHDNDLVPRSECVDVKEGAVGNMVQRNTCQRSQDPLGAGFSSRGIATVFVDNISRDNVGAGIRLGGDTSTDGVRSVVRGNQLINNRGVAVKVQTQPQAEICGNIVEGNAGGPSNAPGVNPAAACLGPPPAP